jgi:hypothetical protein
MVEADPGATLAEAVDDFGGKLGALEIADGNRDFGAAEVDA